MSGNLKKNLVARKGIGNKRIEGGMNRNPECGDTAPDLSVDDDNEEREEEMERVKIYMRNHSSSYFVRWSWFVGIGMFLVEMLGMMIFGIFHLSANYVFPGAVGAERRALIIGAAAFLVKITAGRWTSSHLDPIRSIASTVSFIFTRGRRLGGGAVWMELIKLPIFVIAQWIGFLLALTALGLWTGTDIKTSDCTVPIPTPAVCDVYPVRDVFVTLASLDWLEVFGAMMIYGTFVWGERFFAWHYPGILFSALFFGAGHYLVHLLWSTATGGSFSFWYWSMTGWFSNIDDPDRASYVWPLMVGVFIVMLVDIVIFYVVERIAKRQPDGGSGYDHQA
jgi:hypothetical protein